jgi:hypothetical protein
MLQEYFFNFDFTGKDTKKHFPITFDVREGAKEIIIYGSFKPESLGEEESKGFAKEALRVYLNQGDTPLDIDTLPQSLLEKFLSEFIPIRNLINFRLFDPLGNFRGTGDNRLSKGIPIKIGENVSSFGCVPGEIYPGIWRLVVETHAVVNMCRLELKIVINDRENNDIPELALDYKPVYNNFIQKKGWVKGDFHSHSKHSDGELSIDELVKNAINRGLDFIFLTDHNKISGWESAKSEKFPLLPGIEISTFWGHFTSFGVTKYIEWDKINPTDGIDKLSELVHLQGGLFCVAHPFTIGDPVCTGCRCIIDIDYRYVDALEVWAGTFSQRRHENTEALKLWRRLLNEGYKVVGIGSTDIHSLNDIYPDVPKTYVWVEELTLDNLLSSIKRGKVFVTRGPKVEFHIDDASIGDSIKASNNYVDLSYSISEESELRIIYNGSMISEVKTALSGVIGLKPDEPGYIYLEFWRRGELIALTNPIFIEN